MVAISRACRLQLDEAVRAFSLIASLIAVTVGCHKNAARAPLAPTQPSAPTGSSDRSNVDAPVDTTPTSPPAAPAAKGTYGPVYFAYDNAGLDERARNEVSNLWEWLSSHPTSRVQVAGHTDERGTTEYNLALGERRASSVKDYLVRLGVAAERVVTISFGEERPAAEGSEERSWGLNRRCEFLVADR